MDRTQGDVLARELDARAVLSYIAYLVESDWKVSEDEIVAYSAIEDDGSAIILIAKDGRRYRVSVDEEAEGCV